MLEPWPSGNRGMTTAPTVDLGPRPEMVDGGGELRRDPIRAISVPTTMRPTRAEGTRTVTPPAGRPRRPTPVHALPTQQLPSARKAEPTRTRREYSTATSPVEAMRLEEIARTQIFLKVAILTCVARRHRRARSPAAIRSRSAS